MPIGTIITNLETDEKMAVVGRGQKVLLLKGGYGGFGNEHFKSSINTTPKEWQNWARRRKGNFKIELELLPILDLLDCRMPENLLF